METETVNDLTDEIMNSVSEEALTDIRHLDMQNMDLNSSLGIITLGAQGRVLNLDELIELNGSDTVDRLLNIPGMFLASSAPIQETGEEPIKDPRDADIVACMEKAIHDGDLNKSGSVKLGAVNRLLEQRGFTLVKSAKIKELMDTEVSGVTLAELARHHMKKDQELNIPVMAKGYNTTIPMDPLT